MSDLDLSVVYRRAAELLTERGWSQEEYQDGCGRLCIVGAVNVAAGLEPNAGSTDDTRTDFTDLLTRPLDDLLGMWATVWNDQHCANRDDAIALLLEVAA